jgi:hypothetical protein
LASVEAEVDAELSAVEESSRRCIFGRFGSSVEAVVEELVLSLRFEN